MDYSSTKTTEKESKIELLQSDNRGSLCSGSVVSSSAYIRSELPTVCGQSNCRGEVHEERQQSQLPKVSSVVAVVVVDKGNTYLENKTCSKTCKEGRKCALFGNSSSSNLGEVFEESVPRIGYRITREESVAKF